MTMGAVWSVTDICKFGSVTDICKFGSVTDICKFGSVTSRINRPESSPHFSIRPVTGSIIESPVTSVLGTGVKVPTLIGRSRLAVTTLSDCTAGSITSGASSPWVGESLMMVAPSGRRRRFCDM